MAIYYFNKIKPKSNVNSIKVVPNSFGGNLEKNPASKIFKT